MNQATSLAWSCWGLPRPDIVTKLFSIKADSEINAINNIKHEKKEAKKTSDVYFILNRQRIRIT